MPENSLLQEHGKVQSAAKLVLSILADSMEAADSEETIAKRAHKLLTTLGFAETWYYQCPAFVLAGPRSCLSISGREYVPSRDPIGDFNLVTVDLSPMNNGHWGDCARSFYIENGRASREPVAGEFLRGKEFLAVLHKEMREIVQPSMSFHELFDWTNNRIAVGKFENLDFLGNVGHSIATKREDRQFIEANNQYRLGDVPFFTFEPHVRELAGHWGFKHENIFYFDNAGGINEL